jgi:zinc protease
MTLSTMRISIIALLLPLLSLLEGNLQAMPPVQKMVLSNDLVILISEDHSLPFVTFQLLIDSGSRRDPPGEDGLSYLTARGLLLGTSRRNVTAINEELDFMGASLDVSPGRDYTVLSLRTLKNDLDKGFNLFTEILTQPTFPKEEIKREVEKTLAAIQSVEVQPEEVAEKEFQRSLFLISPYGHPVEGTKESVPRLKREEVIRFYQTYYHPNNSILAIVGDIAAKEVKARILPPLEKWQMGKISEEPFNTIFAKGPKTVKINRQITQANIILGHRGISRNNPDYYALSVMNYILGGGGFASRLLEEIRDKRGLAYSVASFFDPGKYPGSFQIVLQTKNSSAREAISLALQQMERIQKEPVSSEELEGAKKYLIGSFPLRIDTQEKLANFLIQVEYYDLGLDYPEKYSSLIRSVNQEDVHRVAQAYLRPKNYILVIVANLEEAGMDEPSGNTPSSCKK